MLPHLIRFWECVQTRTPPEIDGSVLTSKVLSRLHPKDNGETVFFDPEAEQWDADLRSIKERIAALEEIKTLNENRIKAAIGAATFGQLPSGERYSFKTQQRAGYTVQATESRTLRRLKG